MFEQYRNDCNLLLEKVLSETPHTSSKAMKYSVLAGGKRIRPMLVFLTGELLKATQSQLDNAAIAVELIHAYSLIHDDLPAMDNAPLRHGKASAHLQFGEAMAILAGDALQSLAFEMIAKNGDTNQVLLLAKAASDMVIGQCLDLEAENKAVDLSQLKNIHQHKTGALILASVQLGALCANVSDDRFDFLTQFAKHLGLAYQIKDDILDVVANSKKSGKMLGSDSKQQKSTYVTLLGLDRAKQELEVEIRNAKKVLLKIPESMKLETLLQFILERDY